MSPRGRLARIATIAVGVMAAGPNPAPLASAAFTEIGSFGTSGAGAGQLDGPSNLDVGPDGSVYVVDRANGRIVKIAPGGTFERAWAKDVGGTGSNVCTAVCQAGTDGSLAGEFQAVEDVAVSPDGTAVYVTDDSNRRVAHYLPDGTFVRAWGRDVTPGGGTEFEVCTSSCKAGIDGEEGGHLRRPQGVAVGPTGDVYVTESLNDRVSQFTPTAGTVTFVRAFGVGVDAAGGSGGFEVCVSDCQAATGGETVGVSTTSGGEVLVADPSTDATLRFSATGEHLGTFAADGSGAGAVTNPRSVDVGEPGGILLTQSTSENGIYRFAADRSFLELFVPGPSATDLSSDAAFAVDGASAYVAQPGRDRVVRYAIGVGTIPPVTPPAVPPAVPPPAPAPPATPPAVVPALPKAAAVIVQPSAKKCVSRRAFRIRLKQPKGFTLRSATVSVNGKRVATRSGKRVTAPVDLRGLPKGRFSVRIVVTLSDGRTVTSARRYRTCAVKRG